MKNLVRYFSILCGVGYCFSPFSNMYGQGIPSVDSIIMQQIALKNISGGVAYVWHQNKVLLHKAYGYADRDRQIAMQNNAIFRIASNTKAIISIAVLQLVERGKIRLDDPIELYIPAFRNQKVYSKKNDSVTLVEKIRSVTIRDLLTHQSGISSADEYPSFKSEFDDSVLFVVKIFLYIATLLFLISLKLNPCFFEKWVPVAIIFKSK